jgi:thiamine kinase-like enzyme
MIALTEPKLFQYLLYRGIIPKDSVSDYSISKIGEDTTRNNVFVVTSSDRQILVKQPKLFDEKNLLTFAQERTATKFFNGEEAKKTALLIVNYTDNYNKILFFDYQKDFKNLRKFILDERDETPVIESLARIFNFLYTKKHQLKLFKKLDLPEFKPFFLSYEINKLFKFLYKVEHIDLVRFCNDFNCQLSCISKIWDDRIKDGSFILHGDVRPDNILVKDEEFILIDWELSCYGDKLWDSAYFVGHFIYDYLLDRNAIILSKDILTPFIESIEDAINELKIFNNYLAIVLLLFIYQNPSHGQMQIEVYNLCGKLLKDPSKKLSKHLNL